MTSRIFLDTRELFDAFACGYGSPRDPFNPDHHPDGLIVELHDPVHSLGVSGDLEHLSITTGENSIDLYGPEISQITFALTFAAKAIKLRKPAATTQSPAPPTNNQSPSPSEVEARLRDVASMAFTEAGGALLTQAADSLRLLAVENERLERERDESADRWFRVSKLGLSWMKDEQVTAERALARAQAAEARCEALSVAWVAAEKALRAADANRRGDVEELIALGWEPDGYVTGSQFAIALASSTLAGVSEGLGSVGISPAEKPSPAPEQSREPSTGEV